MPGIVDGSPDEGYRIEFRQGTAYHWPAPLQPDPRILEHPRQPVVQPTCWFADDMLTFRVVPADSQSYRLTLYVLDYDRNGRASEITISDEFAPLDVAEVSAAESMGGVYLTWQVTGPVNVQLRKKAGHNVVLSGVFVH
jgi:hypothetical protein